jgi:serine/threonine-protein kinase
MTGTRTTRPPGVPLSLDPLLGALVGGWRISRLIGRGGMGHVYEAHARGQRVAIKVMHGDASRDGDAMRRFFAEARIADLLRHPNLVDVHGTATLPDGRPYIVMEYLEGRPLAALIRPDLPLGSVAAVICQALDALHAVHARGIVHRDLTPANLFVTTTGQARVLDFGLAKLPVHLAGALPSTGDGLAVGTPPYMAPEYVRGGRHDHLSDLYAIGITLFQAATGRLPFTADDPRTLFRLHVSADPPRPTALRPDLPAGYESVILQALFKTPSLRFESAAAMADTLRKATHGLPAAAWAPLLR